MTLREAENRYFSIKSELDAADAAIRRATRRDPNRRPFMKALVIYADDLGRAEREAYRALHNHPDYVRS